jgi:hypothetical protein
MRFILMVSPILLVSCNQADRQDEARYLAQFRADGVRSCMRGEGLMQPQWSVPPERLQQTCECIVAAFTEGKTRRTLQHPTVGDQLHARERCSNGAPPGLSPRQQQDAAEMQEAVNAMMRDIEGNGSRSGK